MWSSPLSTIASGQGSPYFSSRWRSRLPAFTPIRMEQPWSRAALMTSLTRFSSPMLPGVDAQASRARLGGLDAALVVEVDVRHDRHVDLGDDLLQRSRALLVGHRDAHDVGPRFGAGIHLSDRRVDIRGQRVRHGLNADRRVPADGHATDMDLPALAAIDVAPGSDVVDRHRSLHARGLLRWREPKGSLAGSRGSAGRFQTRRERQSSRRAEALCTGASWTGAVSMRASSARTSSGFSETRRTTWPDLPKGPNRSAPR